MADADYIFFVERRPRCLACGSDDLRAYKSSPPESDGSRMRYVVCRTCAKRWKLIVEPEHFHGVESAEHRHGE